MHPRFLLLAMLPLALGLLLTSLLLAAQPPAAEKVPQLLTPASAVAPALAFAKLQADHRKPFLRFVSAYEAEEDDLPNVERTLALVTNSLSRDPLARKPLSVPRSGGRLWAVFLDELRIDPKVWDRLIELGSGRTPLPQPYFNQVTETLEDEYEWYGKPDGYGGYTKTWKEKTGKKIKKTKLALAAWLPQEPAVQLASEVRSNTPLVRWDWLAYYALLEPRYHEFLGVNDLYDVFKLADADPVVVDELGVETKGVVLRSEVATNTRGLRREPTRLRRGKGYFWISDDYASSVKQDDLLASAQQLIKARPQAHEVIWTLPNGLQGYLVTDGNNKRLDRAGIEFAHDTRNGFASVEVEIRNCFCCHAIGILPIHDRVRLVTKKKLALQVEQIKREDARLAQQIVDRFFASDIAEEVQDDQQTYAAAVKAVTGQAAAAAGLALRRALLGYEADLDLAQLARETGYPEEVVKGVLERSREANLDQSVLATAVGEKARRDQVEAQGFAQLMLLLSAVPHKDK